MVGDAEEGVLHATATGPRPPPPLRRNQQRPTRSALPGFSKFLPHAALSTKPSPDCGISGMAYHTSIDDGNYNEEFVRAPYALVSTYSDPADESPLAPEIYNVVHL